MSKETEMELDELLKKFMEKIANGEVEVYNEFSLQHELGIFLRENLPDYKIQFERNAKFFGIEDTIKHEMDIVIYKDKETNTEKYAIELKYPLNGQYPEQMFSFIKDIKFMEEIMKNGAKVGFKTTYCLTLVKDKNFYSGKKLNDIYAYFRGENPIPVQGKIQKPTGNNEERITINKNRKYAIHWLPCHKEGEGDEETKNRKYYIVKIPPFSDTQRNN
jgi:hypothetical protein